MENLQLEFSDALLRAPQLQGYLQVPCQHLGRVRKQPVKGCFEGHGGH